jgi:acyl-ACP thioesterase
MNKVSEYHFQVLGPDVNFRDKLHLHSLFGMLQEAASRSATEHGWGSEEMDKHNACWLLLRISVVMSKLPSWQDKLTVATWSRGFQRLYFLRDFLIYDSLGQEIGKATSMWIAADKDSHRPIRPVLFTEISQETSIDKFVLYDSPPKLDSILSDLKAQEGGPSIVKYADYSEIDRNMHVNNTRYIAWCMDAAHTDILAKSDILSVDINYLSEIKFKEKVDLFVKEEDDIIQVDGIVRDSNRYAFCCRMYKSDFMEVSS